MFCEVTQQVSHLNCLLSFHCSPYNRSQLFEDLAECLLVECVETVFNEELARNVLLNLKCNVKDLCILEKDKGSGELTCFNML